MAWYRGDFHAHTTCSDGLLRPPDLLALARDLKLDFLAITDHNNDGAFAQLEQQPGLLLLRGMEVTLKTGHFNVFGLHGWAEWMEGICVQPVQAVALSGRSHNALLQACANDGLLSSMNHPLLQPWEWQDEATEVQHWHCLEVWNDPTWPDNAQANPAAVAMWSRWLNAGHRVTAIGGSDYHGPRTQPAGYAPKLAEPTTWVRAEELSVAGILTALRHQRAYVTMGPALQFQAEIRGATLAVGDDAGQAGGVARFLVGVSAAPEGSTARLVQQGRVVAEMPLPDGRLTWQPEARLDPGLANDWYRLELVDVAGRILALTNPIFAGRWQAQPGATFGQFR